MIDKRRNKNIYIYICKREKWYYLYKVFSYSSEVQPQDTTKLKENKATQHLKMRV